MAGEDRELDDAYRRLAFAPDAGGEFAVLVAGREREIAAAVGCRTPFDDEAVHDALVDETLRLIAGASSYDPEKRAMLPYLKMVAGRKLINAWRGEDRRRANVERMLRFAGEESVAADADAGNESAEAEWEAVRLEEAQAVLDENDHAYLLAAARGADDSELASLLGADAAGLPAARRRAVERIRKRLQRGGLI